MQGLHLTADLSGCKKNLPLMTDVDKLRRNCIDLVGAAGLTVVGDLFHAFPGLNEGDTIVTGSYQSIRSMKNGTTIKIDNKVKTEKKS